MRPTKTFHYIMLALILITACSPGISTIPAATSAASGVSAPAETPFPAPTQANGPADTPTAGLAPATAATAPPAEIEINVFFTHRSRYALGIQPFEEPVLRRVPAETNLPEAVLIEFFKGPTAEETAGGVEQIASGFTGFDRLEIQNGVARVYLTGSCSSMGATYTIAQPIMRNLLQFEDIRYVKIYDEQGTTEVPEGESNSIPFCLEP